MYLRNNTFKKIFKKIRMIAKIKYFSICLLEIDNYCIFSETLKIYVYSVHLFKNNKKMYLIKMFRIKNLAYIQKLVPIVNCLILKNLF